MTMWMSHCTRAGEDNPGRRLKTLENPGSITADAVNVFTVPDGGIVLEASTTYFVQVKTTSSDRVAVSVTGPLSGGNAEDDGAAENWTIDNGSRTNRPSIGTWQASNQSMRIDVKGEVLLDPPTNPSARAVAPMRVTLEWDRTLPSPKGTIDRDDGYKIEWSADGNDPWTSLVNVTNQYVTDSDIWCTCYPTRFNDNTIAPGTTRHYRIKAVDDDDESAWSDVVSATTPGLVDSDQGRFEYGAVVSEFNALTDQKVFRIDLDPGESYRFTIAGKATRHRVIVTDPGGTETWNDVLEANNTLIPRFTTQGAGDHQVKISHGGSPGQYTSLNAGWFQFVLVPERDDESEFSLTPLEGTLELLVLNTYGDVDRIGLLVQPGKAYAVRVRGRETDEGTAATPRIKRAMPPATNHQYNMGKPWVEGVTTTEESTVTCKTTKPGDSDRCQEFQAFVIDLRGQTGAQQTWHIIVAPTARPRTYPYSVGIYSVLLDELSASQLEGVRMPLRGWFASQPSQHDGSERIKVRVAFSDAVHESPENVGEHGVEVEGGEVTSVRPVDGNAPGGAGAAPSTTRSVGGQDGEVVWEFEIEPDSDADVTVSLEAWRPCDEPGAICTADGRVLSEGISTTVRGPAAAEQEPQEQERPDQETAVAEQEPQEQEEEEQPQAPPALTARFVGMPAKHNAKNAIRFRVAFSEDIGISFRSLREDAFTVSGGRVTGGKRVDGRRDLFEMTVRPVSNGDVTITLPAGRKCGVSGAICTKGENRRKLTNAPSATVRGPAAAEQKPQQQQRPDQAAAAAQEPQQQEQEQPDHEEAAAAEQEPPQKPPPPPRNLTGVANDDGSVTLSWDAPGDDSVTGYRILRRHTVKQNPGVFSTLAANTGSTATTYTDRVASPETRYAYRVKAINAAGAGKRSNYVKVTTKRAAPSSKPAIADGPPGLAPNAPNPFNANTLIPYRLDTDGPVRLEIYNLLGQSIRTLVDEAQTAGAYRVSWDARDVAGRHVSTGVYFLRLHHPGGVHTRRMLYLK